MTYYTINIKITEKLSSSQVLSEMREGAIEWGYCIGKTPTKREEIKKIGNNYYMKVGYK
jgi:hypothetical protein|tara:strand:+ start:874 stop:1050 length:177 start_codon:yes stop_codon:yes gene_type:complete